VNQAAFQQFTQLMKSSKQHESLAATLNAANKAQGGASDYQFVDQDKMQDLRYYEEIIFQDKCIPTRNNSLHDYFNGLIWLRYPKTKVLLNQLHWQDIKVMGHKKRTPKRDRITHFDECGMVLLTNKSALRQQLREHKWTELFYHQRDDWYKYIVPLHFGHANLEMLCQPFIGLTAKALVIDSPALLAAYHQDREKGQSVLDGYLAGEIESSGIFDEKGVLTPLPILGIPEWHNATQDLDFYANTDYFMPVKGR
jgi:hypothetical protein